MSTLKHGHGPGLVKYDRDEDTVTMSFDVFESDHEKVVKLRAALDHLVYEDGGKWYTGLHGDTDVSDVVGHILFKYNGG